MLYGLEKSVTLALTPPRGWEIVIILFVVLLIFGAKKLPDLARSLGSSAKEFRKGLKDGVEDDEDSNASTDA